MISKLFKTAIFILFGTYVFLLSLIINHQYLSEPKLRKISSNIKPDVRKLAEELYPHLTELVKLPYFRYYRVNLNQKCIFKLDDNVCRTRMTCQLISQNQNNSLPATFLEEDRIILKRNVQFSNYDIFEFVKPFYDIQRHDWSFDLILADNIYVDLIIDKEQYTGYQGQDIWNKIYQENCLGFSQRCNNNQILYQIISGMHTSVSSHISEHFIDWENNITYPNTEMYYKMVGSDSRRLSNLFFAWEVLVQGYLRYYDVISRMSIRTQHFRSDVRTQTQLGRIWEILADYPEQELLINDFTLESGQLDTKEVFLRYFTNITRLMDCVECIKCKVYGKLQIMGMGTALRILLNPQQGELTRNELVSIVNTLNKWTESIVIFTRMQHRLSIRRLKQTLLLTASFFLILLPLIFAWKRLKIEKLN